jgi:hypothetical protein
MFHIVVFLGHCSVKREQTVVSNKFFEWNFGCKCKRGSSRVIR